MKTIKQILAECKGEEDFKPHMMYDPKTGKGYKADTYADHVKMDKMGYTHEKPELDEAADPVAAAFFATMFLTLVPFMYIAGDAMRDDLKKLKAKSAKKGFKPSKEDQSLLQKFIAMVKRKKPDAVSKAMKKANESVELEEGVSKTYKGNTIHQVGKHRSYDDMVAYKLSNADAKILNKFMKSASAKERTQMHNMFWKTDEKDTDDVTAAKGPKMAIAYAKKKINEASNPYAKIGGSPKNPEVRKNLKKSIADLKKKTHGKSKKEELEEGAENYTMKKGTYTRKVDGKTADKMKKDGWKLVAREEVEEGKELDEAFQQFLDKSPSNWGEDKVVAYGEKKGHKVIGVVGTGKVDGIVLFGLDAGDKKYVGKEAKVKTGQTVFRYATRNSMAGDLFPLIKIDVKRGLMYHLTQASSSGDIDHAEFESRSVKLKYLRFAATANLRDITGFDPGFGSMKEGSAQDRLRAKLKKGGLDLDKRAKDRKAEHERLKKQYGKNESFDLDTHMENARAKRDAMGAMGKRGKDSADIDTDATDDDRKAASKNVLMQIRKLSDLPKGGEIEFENGKKGKISQDDASKVVKMFNTLKKPQDKAKFQKVISKDLRTIQGLLKRLGR